MELSLLCHPLCWVVHAWLNAYIIREIGSEIIAYVSDTPSSSLSATLHSPGPGHSGSTVCVYMCNCLLQPQYPFFIASSFSSGRYLYGCFPASGLFQSMYQFGSHEEAIFIIFHNIVTMLPVILCDKEFEMIMIRTIEHFFRIGEVSGIAKVLVSCSVAFTSYVWWKGIHVGLKELYVQRIFPAGCN